jgi:hypothetical protein
MIASFHGRLGTAGSTLNSWSNATPDSAAPRRARWDGTGGKGLTSAPLGSISLKKVWAIRSASEDSASVKTQKVNATLRLHYQELGYIGAIILEPSRRAEGGPSLW